ncbi:MAG: EI24 domain-containing protein [Desulfamplus sp.]|nr:EI24 domain-containing protein [Desulfamplus sp.]
MAFIKGVTYNLKGLIMGLTTPKLLWLGLLRVVVVVVLTILSSAIVLMWHQEILNLIWQEPESGWILFVWRVASWILSVFLAAVSAIFSYIVAQLLFAIFVMDYMSRITEKIILGHDAALCQEPNSSFFRVLLYLISQEIPRAIIPLLLMLFIVVLGFFTPFGPVVAIVSSIIAAIFLAWDNTDLVPARRMLPFRSRFGFLKKEISFHLGFGIWFLIPWVNILFLSFAPVGATIYFIEKEQG